MIEQNTRAAEHIVGLTIFLDNPIAIEFCNSIWAVRMEWSILILWHLLNFTIQL